MARSEAAEFKAIPLEAPATSMEATEDGVSLVVAHEEVGKLSILDVKTGSIVKTVDCPTPRHILCRGGKVYVANYGKGTLSVFDPQKNWTMTDQLLAGEKNVYYLSAPSGKYFKGLLVTTCGAYGNHHFYLIDVAKDVPKKLRDEMYAAVATFSYKGDGIIQQGEFNHSPCAVPTFYEVGPYLAGDSRAAQGRGEHTGTPYLYQTQPGQLWFGRNSLYAGMPPKPLGAQLGRLVFPDALHPVFYVLGTNNTITTHRLDAAMARLAAEAVSLPPAMKPDGFVELHAKCVFFHPVAVSDNNAVRLFDLDKDGRTVYAATLVAPAQTIAATPQEPGPITSPENFPSKVFEGKPIALRLFPAGTKGVFTVVSGPIGIKISSSGELAWTPTMTDVGRHNLKIKCEAGGTTTFLRIATEVISKEIAALAGGNSANLADLGVHYFVSDAHDLQFALKGDEILFLEKDQFKILDASGFVVKKQFELESSYMRLFERPDDYLALNNGALDFLNKQTLKVRKSIRLPGSGVTDLVLHPNQRMCYVALYDDEGGKLNPLAARKILAIDELKGTIKELDRVLGQWLTISPDGRYLYTALREIYRAGYQLDWVIGDIRPGYGNIDIVVCYEITGESVRHRYTNLSPGANGRVLRIASDGRNVAYVAGGGYRSGESRLQGYTIAAFDTPDIRSAKVSYKTDAYPRDISFHPILDLVAVCNDDRVVICQRKTGDILAEKLDLKDAKLSALRGLFFTPDGRHLLIDSKDESGRSALRAFAIRLTDAERSLLQKGRHKPPPASFHDDARPTAATAAQKSARKKIPLSDFDSLLGARTERIGTKEVANRFMNSVVVVKTGESNGSGFVVGGKGYLLTCAHVLPLLGDPTVSYRVTEGGAVVTHTAMAEVLATDKKRDLALLKIAPVQRLTPVAIESSGTLEMGEAVSIIGNPGLGAEILNYTMTEGIISSSERVIDGASYIQTTAAVNPGTSGAPLFNSRGNVIGLVVLKANLENTGFAVPVDSLISFLRANAVSSPTSTTTTRSH